MFPRLVGESDGCQWNGSSINWQGVASERERVGSDGRLLGRGDALRHPGYPQNRVGDPATVDLDAVDRGDIVVETVSAIVVLVGTHDRDLLGGAGICFGRVCGRDE